MVNFSQVWYQRCRYTYVVYGPGAGLCQRPDLQDRAWTTAHMKIFVGAILFILRHF